MASGQPERFQVVVLVCADAEWSAVMDILQPLACSRTLFGEAFEYPVSVGGESLLVRFFHGGWGKIAAAASTQYAIHQWKPDLLVNLGTCGGFRGKAGRGEILLAERTLVYDILEQMGDFDEHIAYYTTALDLSWLGKDHPQPVRRSLLVSADRDLLPGDIQELEERYGAVAGDWESGAIAWTAARSGCRCLILRGVTDLVSPLGGEVYGDLQGYQRAAHTIMRRLLADLPGWLEAASVITARLSPPAP